MPIIEIETPDGVAEFPDSMTDDEIQTILRREYPPQPTPDQQQGLNAVARAANLSNRAIDLTQTAWEAGRVPRDVFGQPSEEGQPIQFSGQPDNPADRPPTPDELAQMAERDPAPTIADVLEHAGAAAFNIPAAMYRSATGVTPQQAYGRGGEIGEEPASLPFQPHKPVLEFDRTVLQPEGNDLTRLAEGLLTPGMLATFPFAATKPVQLYFLSQTAPGAVAAVGRLLDKNLEPDERRSAATDLLVNSVMSYGLTRHLTKPRAGTTTVGERTPDALDQIPAQSVRVMREEPVQVAPEVPAEVSGGAADVGGNKVGAEAQAPEVAARPWTYQNINEGLNRGDRSVPDETVKDFLSYQDAWAEWFKRLIAAKTPKQVQELEFEGIDRFGAEASVPGAGWDRSLKRGLKWNRETNQFDKPKAPEVAPKRTAPTVTKWGRKVGDHYDDGMPEKVATSIDETTGTLHNEYTVKEVLSVLSDNEIEVRRRDMTPDEIKEHQARLTKANEMAAELGLPQTQIPEVFTTVHLDQPVPENLIDPALRRAPEVVPPELMTSREFTKGKVGEEWDQADKDHRNAIQEALDEHKPVLAASMREYAFGIPPGYVREGDLIVYKPEPPKPATPEAIAAQTGFTYDASMEQMVPQAWHFTDNRPESPTRSLSVAVPKGATLEQVQAAIAAKVEQGFDNAPAVPTEPVPPRPIEPPPVPSEPVPLQPTPPEAKPAFGQKLLGEGFALRNTASTESTHEFIVEHAGTPIGTLLLQNEDGRWQVQSIGLKSFRGKGIGGKAIVEIAKEFGTLYSSGSTSPAAAKMWARIGAKEVPASPLETAEGKRWRYDVPPEAKPAAKQVEAETGQPAAAPAAAVPAPAKAALIDELLGPKPPQNVANAAARVKWDKDAKLLSKRTADELAVIAADKKLSDVREAELAVATRQIIPELEAIAKAGGQRWRTVLRAEADARGVRFPTASGMSRGDVVYYVARAVAERRQAEPKPPQPTPTPAAPKPEPPPQQTGTGKATGLSPTDKGISKTEKAFRSTAEGQKAMASRASRIATLSMMNEGIRKLDPNEAFDRSLIESLPDSQIDKWQEDLRQTWNRLKQPTPPPPKPTETPEGEAGKPDVGPGMGAAIPAEYDRSFSTPTGIKNAEMNKVLAQLGQPPLPDTLGKPDLDLWNRVMSRIDADPTWQDTLIADLKQRPRVHTDEEVLALDHRLVDLRVEHAKASREAAQAYEDGRTDAMSEATTRAQIWSDRIKELSDITKSSGTETGRALRARRLMLNADFSLAALEMQKREANGWRHLTPDERAEIQKTHDDYAKKTAELEAALAATRAKLVDTEIARALAEAGPKYHPNVLAYAERFATFMDKKGNDALARLREKMGRTSAGVDPTILSDVAIVGAAKITRGLVDFAKWSDAMLKDLGDWVKPHLQDAWAQSQKVFESELADATRKETPAFAAEVKKAAFKKKDAAEKITDAKEKITAKAAKGELSEIYPFVQKLIRGIVEQNPKILREELIDQVHTILTGIEPKMTRLETMDAISGRGRFTLPRQDEISKTVADLKTQTRLVGHQIDVEARRPLPRTGFQPRKMSDIARREEQKLNDLKRRFGVTVTDPATQLASVLQARKIYYTHRMADLKYEIAKRERTVKTKTPSPTDAALEKLKAEYEQVKKEHAEIFVKPGLTDAQRLALSEKAADRQIAELERQLRVGEIFPPGKKPPGPTSPALEAKRARIQALKDEREWARDLIQPKPQPLDVEASRRAEVLNKRITELERQIRMEEVFPPGKKARVETPENQARLAELEKLKEQRQGIRDRLQPGPERDPVAMALKARKAYMTRRIAELAQKMAVGDYLPKAKKPPVDISADPVAMRLMAELEQIKAKHARGLALDRAKRRSLPAKIYAGVKEVINLPRAIWSSFDVSAVGRQGGFIGAGHPLRAARSLVPMFRALASEKAALTIEQQILNRPNAPLYARSKLYIASLDEFRLSKQEEIMMSRYANLIPGVRMSNRAFMTYLNKLRADSFDAMLKSRNRWASKPVEQHELDAIANYINVATGRGNLGKAVAAAEELATVFWSPRLVTSRFQLMAAQPLYRGSAVTRALVASEYARSLIGLGTVVGLAGMLGASIELDPNSSDFLKLKFGNTRVDIFGGLIQNTVLLNRLRTGKIKTARGQTKPARSEMTWQFLRSKFTPTLGMAYDARDIAVGQKPPPGHPQTFEEMAKRAAVPLAWADAYDIMIDDGVPPAVAFELLSLFGVGVQNYQDKR